MTGESDGLIIQGTGQGRRTVTFCMGWAGDPFDRNPELWKYGIVKTTLEIPDDLYRAVKAKAALEGRKMRDVVEQGLRLALGQRPESGGKRVSFPLIKAKPGGRKLTAEEVAQGLERMAEEDAASIEPFVRR